MHDDDADALSKAIWELASQPVPGGRTPAMEKLWENYASFGEQAVLPLLEVICQGSWEQNYSAILGIRSLGYEAGITDEFPVENHDRFRFRRKGSSHWLYLICAGFTKDD